MKTDYLPVTEEQPRDVDELRGRVLDVVQSEVLDVGEKTLEELAEAANREHQATGAALADAVSHAIRCGEALLEARTKVGPADWNDWVETNLDIRPQNAGQYMRLAFYKGKIPLEAYAPYKNRSGSVRYPTFTSAAMYVRGLPAIFGYSSHRRIPQELEREARRLRKAGMSYEAIAPILGISRYSVGRACVPGSRERQTAWARKKRRLRSAAEKALKEQQERNERDRAATSAGGALSETYAFLRRAVQKADEAMMQSGAEEERSSLRLAITRLHEAEDELVKALRIK